MRRSSWILLATLAAYMPSAALPVLALRHGVPGGPVDPSALVVPFSLAFAAAFPLWGRAADRVAAGRAIAAALTLMLIAGVGVAVAPSRAALIAARALQGAAAAGVPPAAQAALAEARAEDATGRALSPMMLAVAFAVLGGPEVASVAGDAGGWAVAALLTGCSVPLALLVIGMRHWTPAAARLCVGVRPRVAASYENPRGVRAGWIVSALVLGGHWTVLTRIAEALGPGGLGAANRWIGLAPLTGALGLPLVVLAGRASDRVGPRTPMVATLVAGSLGFGLAAGAAEVAVFVAAVAVGLSVYWAYLPVVAAQVQRSAGAAARGRAAGGLYASMWWAAAVAGALASLAPSWRVVLGCAALSWAAGAAVAHRRFIGASTRAYPQSAGAPETA